MPDLIAQGATASQRWRRALPEGRSVLVGRSEGEWNVSWDLLISGKHFSLCWMNGKLEIKALPSARNPLYFKGSEQETITLTTGEHFVVGDTSFILTDEKIELTQNVPLPAAEEKYSREYLRELQFKDTQERIELISQIAERFTKVDTDQEFCEQVLNLVLNGMPRAKAVAVVEVCKDTIEVLHWDRPLVTKEGFYPSETLILKAHASQESIIHIWNGPQSSTPQATLTENMDWAFCIPFSPEMAGNWVLYVAGQYDRASPGDGSTDPYDLREEVKFGEIVVSNVGSIREKQQLERSQASLRPFFSPVVLDALKGKNPQQSLEPCETEVTVMFCDLRGFSEKSEAMQDNLFDLLKRVSDALGVMTRQLLEQGAVIGDFHGDAAMGFWGWPLVEEGVVNKVSTAALGIRRELELASQKVDHPLHNFQMGIGIATGRAVAGKIGTTDQVKVTVFGPVVNLASRLEGMTKTLHSPILLDEKTAKRIRLSIPTDIARVRRLAIVRPFGLQEIYEVSELLPPEQEHYLSNLDLVNYEKALDAFLGGRWQESLEWLHQVTTKDHVKDFLTVYIAQHNRVPPKNWEGFIPLQAK
ncbi:MAG: adenylate/guanylate cyclase domain-containing protein [Pirellulaceae bacterium]|nr:adenylate/guanylate cyclase domain-containing protein [Pirellulaceae bacterium]